MQSSPEEPTRAGEEESEERMLSQTVMEGGTEGGTEESLTEGNIMGAGRITRGNGEWTKGQHSWNISITKEARMDPEVVLDSSAECLFRGIFFCP